MAFPRIFSLPAWALGIGYLAGYTALDWVSFIHPFAPFGITPWNPPTGLSFVLVLLFGQRFVPLLFVSPLLADLLVRHLPFPWGIELATIAVTGGGYAAGLAVLLMPATRFNPALTSMRDLLVLLSAAALSAAFVAASYVGIIVLAGLLPARDFLAAAMQYWVGDMIGIAVVTPFALLSFTRRPLIVPTPEVALQALAIVATLALAFAYAERHHFQLFYLLFLPVVWLAVRGGLERVTAGIMLTQIGLIAGLQFIPQADVSVTTFQSLMLVLALTGLIAGALVTQHRRIEFQLRLHQDSLARLARLGSMGELAAAVAHEINQPLTAAGTYARLVADTLRSGDGDPHTVAQTATKAVNQVERAAEVVRRLRALIRLDQSGRAPVSVARIVREALELSQPNLNRHHVEARIELDPRLPPVTVDLLQVEQVLLNLLRNAVEAISEAGHGGGLVTIAATRRADDAVEIEVRDSGPGFPPEFVGAELPQLMSTKSEGLGVGLSLSRSIVEAHGGRLSVGGKGDGAVVRFTLPVAETAGA